MRKLTLTVVPLALCAAVACGGGGGGGGGSDLSVSTSALPQATVGAAYAMALSATGGTTPYAWSVAAGTLPAGLSLTGDTGAVAGTPTVAGTASFTVQVADASVPARTASKALTIKVVASGGVAITTASLPIGRVGSAYSTTLAASGGAGPYAWSVTSGSLPAGLSLASAAGVLSGTPTVAGSATFTVEVGDASQPRQAASREFTLLVSPASILTLATNSLPSGVVGSSYSAALVATGGATPYSWSVSSGTLPAGLALGGSTGIVAGTPTASGGSTFTVRVTDASQPVQSAERSLTIAVALHPSLAILLPNLGPATVGVPYDFALAADGGVPPYHWSLASGALPAGLVLDGAAGTLSGTPLSAGTMTFTVRVTDSGLRDAYDSQGLSLSVGYPSSPRIPVTHLPDGTTGTSYRFGLFAEGGATPYGWSLSWGNLPPGLVLDPGSGVISGTPLSAGATSVTVRITDASSPAQAATQWLSLAVGQPSAPRIPATHLPDGTTGTAYAFTLSASGGATPYTWSLSSGSLPPGLVLDPTSGAISGTPSTSGLSGFAVRLVDASSPAQSDVAWLQLAVHHPSVLRLPAANLPAGVVGSPYAFTLSASGGAGPYTFSLTAGSLPAGLTLAPATGTISGTPSGEAVASFWVRVTDASSPAQSDERSMQLSVGTSPPDLAVATPSLPAGLVGRPYGATLAASGGSAPYTWSLSYPDALPPGLALNAATGTIGGTPSGAGTYPISVYLQDSAARFVGASLEIFVAPASSPAITTARLPEAKVGAAYAQTAVVAGGTAPYTWSLYDPGSLPPGLALNAATGAISGTPTAAGLYPFTLQVQDTSTPAQYATAALDILATPASSPVITTPYLAYATVGTAYAQTLAVAGGKAPYTWSVNDPASLPSGLTFNAATGAFGGTPSAAGLLDVTVQVQDSSTPAQYDSAPYQFAVDPASRPVVTTPYLPVGKLGTAYAASLAVSGGTPPYTWSQVTSDGLPPGVALDAVSGAIAGTPTARGSWQQEYTVTDASTPRLSARATLAVLVR